MKRRIHTFDEESLASERAFDWLDCLDRLNTRDVEAFHTWICRSPQNSCEVLVATSTELVLRRLFKDSAIDVEQLLAKSANVLSIGDAPLTRHILGRRRTHPLLAVAIGVAAAIATLLVVPPLVADWFQPSEYRTLLGEQRTILLPDGSAVSINTQSIVRIDFSANARDVYLNRGQAMFAVAKDPRPFRVHVAADDTGDSSANKSTVIQALGTKFDVRRRSGRVHVAVVEGVVQIQSDDRARASLTSASSAIREFANVAAGHAVNIESTGLVTAPAPIDRAYVSAWQQRRLVFADNTLKEIAEEFGRYNRTPTIHVEDEELRTRRFSGEFDADNLDGLLSYLAKDDAIVVDRAGSDVILRSKATVARSQQSGAQ